MKEWHTAALELASGLYDRHRGQESELALLVLRSELLADHLGDELVEVNHVLWAYRNPMGPLPDLDKPFDV